MVFESLVKLHNDLSLFDSSKPILVHYDPINKLTYRQLNKVLSVPYIDNMYFPKPFIELGVLLPEEYAELMKGLELLIQDPGLRNGSLTTVLGNYECKVYKVFDDPNLYGPQLYVHLEFVSISRKWMTLLKLWRTDNSTKTLLKAIRNENRKRKSNQLL